MTNQSVVIDGVEVILHDLKQPLSSPSDLYTVIVPNYELEAGLSLGNTEITAEMSDHDIRNRIGSPYFLKGITKFLAERDLGVSSYENLIEQLQGSVREFDGSVAKHGRLYCKGQHMFAKMELNRIWSVDFRNKNYPSHALGFSDEDTSLHGNWYINEDYNGEFFLTHKTKCFDRVTEFQHCGKVSSDHGGLIEQYIVDEFMARWGELMGDQVTENFRVAFNPACVAAGRSILTKNYGDTFFNDFFAPIFDSALSNQVPLPALKNAQELSGGMVLRRGSQTLVMEGIRAGTHSKDLTTRCYYMYDAKGQRLKIAFDPTSAEVEVALLDKIEHYRIMHPGNCDMAEHNMPKMLAVAINDDIVTGETIDLMVSNMATPK